MPFDEYFKAFYHKIEVKMKKYSLFALFILAFGQQQTWAQQEQSLHFVTDIWQSNLTNPALLTTKKINVLLPSVYFNVNSPDFTINEMFKANAEGKLDMTELAKNRLKPQNRLDANINVQSLGFSMPVSNKLTLSIYQATNGNSFFNIRPELVKVLVEGNAQYLGQKVSLGSSANGSFYSEIGLGAAYKIQESLVVGVRVKALSGISGVFTEGSKIDVAFDNTNYALSFDNNFSVKTYSYDKIKNIKTAGDALNQGLFSGNSGLSFDLGATMKLGKMTFAASIIDLAGSINWKENGKGYATNGTFSYSGANSNNFFKIDSINSTAFQDTIKKLVGYSETSNPEFKQKLPTKIYLSGTYQLTEKLRLGALIYNESGGMGDGHTGISLNATTSLGKILNLGGTVGLWNGQVSNLGVSAVIKLGPVQIYGVTDNVFAAIQPYDSKGTNGRVGLNLAF